MFLDSTAHYQEELAMNEDVFVLARNGERAGLACLAHALRGGTHIRLGNLDDAEADCLAARELRAGGKATRPRDMQTNDLAMLGLVELVRGNYEAALPWAEEAEADAGDDDPMTTALALYVASGAKYGQGDYVAATARGERGLELAAGCGDSWFSGYLHLQLAECALAERRYGDAARHSEQVRETRERFGDRQGVALATVRLGDVAFRERDFGAARQQYLHALRLYRDIADRGGRATVLASLAQVDAAERDMPSARTRFLQALEEAEAIGYASALAQVFLGVAAMQADAGDRDGAALLLAYLVRSRTTPRPIRDDAMRVLEQLGLSAVAMREAERNASGLALEDVCRAVKKALAPRGRVASAGVAPKLASAEQPELTQREVQVLALLDRGGTNSSVAKALGLTTNTVKWYCTQIFGKLDAGNRTAALARARELGLLA
jgi:ATP/maltotriose-dependent transcriptional regulator MalT